MVFAVFKQTRNGLPTIVFALFVSVSGGAIAQSGDAYLEALEGEASAVTVDGKTRADTATASQTGAAAPSEASSSGDATSLVPGLTIEQFEQVLQRNYIGSYLFYKRLSNSQKDEIFSAYQSNPDPDAVRSKILQVSKK